VRRRHFVGIAAIAAVSALSPASAAAPQRDQVIRMGKAIGKIQLGMTRPAVRRALGGPHAVVYHNVNFRDRGRYLELGWEFPGRTSWEPVLWQVGFRSWRRGGPMRVVRVSTTARSQRTPQGIGIGMRPRQVVRAYRNATCVGRWGVPHPGIWILVSAPGGGMTAFAIAEREAPRVHRTPMFVVATMVQRTWFSKGTYPHHYDCSAGWEDW
jgi:hypothetical protein